MRYGAANIEAELLVEGMAAGLSEKRESDLAKVLGVAKAHQARKIRGLVFDAFTANVVKQIHDKATPEQRAKMEKMDVRLLAHLANKVMGMARRSESMDLETEFRLIERSFDPKRVGRIDMSKVVAVPDRRVGDNDLVLIIPQVRGQREALDRLRSNVGQELAEKSLSDGTVEVFLTVLSSYLTQYDQQVSKREMKRGRVNIHRLPLLLQAADRVKSAVRPHLKKSDKESLGALKLALGKFFDVSLPPVKKLIKAIDAFVDRGKKPSLVSSYEFDGDPLGEGAAIAHTADWAKRFGDQLQKELGKKVSGLKVMQGGNVNAYVTGSVGGKKFRIELISRAKYERPGSPRVMAHWKANGKTGRTAKDAAAQIAEELAQNGRTQVGQGQALNALRENVEREADALFGRRAGLAESVTLKKQRSHGATQIWAVMDGGKQIGEIEKSRSTKRSLEPYHAVVGGKTVGSFYDAKEAGKSDLLNDAMKKKFRSEGRLGDGLALATKAVERAAK